MAAIDELSDIASRMIGETCWAATGGSGCTGSRFILEIGRKVPLSSVIANEKINPDARRYRGYFNIFVQRAAWRLADTNGIIASWKDEGLPGGPMEQGLNALEGRCLTRVEVSPIAADLQIEFEGGYRLWVFCDEVENGARNYSLRDGNRTALVRARSQIELSVSEGADSGEEKRDISE